MKDFRTRLARGKILVADGAMGTYLMAHGLKAGDCPEMVNLKNPAILEEIARLYFEAGAEILLTNTLGGSPLKLAMYGLEHETETINANAVRAARNIVGQGAYIAASCGPSGRTLKPYGDIEPADVRASFVRQIRALMEAGTDLLCIETMMDLAEAILAIEAAREVSADLPILATLTFNPTPRGFYTMMGNSIADAIATLPAAGADVIGSNCGSGIVNMVAIAREFAAQTECPLIIQSNAGLPQIVDGQTVYSETPEFMATEARALVESGVRIIGGCCGTTPAHIRALKAMVREVEGERTRD